MIAKRKMEKKPVRLFLKKSKPRPSKTKIIEILSAECGLTEIEQVLDFTNLILNKKLLASFYEMLRQRCHLNRSI